MAFKNILTAILLGVCSLVAASADSFENVKVLQTVDLVTPYMKRSYDIVAENTGSVPASSYVFVIPETEYETFAYIEARSDAMEPLDVVRAEDIEIPGHVAYNIVFEAPVQPESERRFAVLVTYSETCKPFPAEAQQSDPQYLLYKSSRNYISVYNTREQETDIKVVTGKGEVLESDGSVQVPELNSSGYLNFGPFEDVGSLESIDLALRYENPLALAQVEKLDRTIWISHWGGSVSFDESYDIKNIGTKLTGPFSRLEYRNPRVGLSLNTAAIHTLQISLPKSHREEYYVDLVGNVSTSKISKNTLDINPRYPVMGGWFYNFTVGWAADLKNYVHEVSSANYILAVPLIGGPENVGYRAVKNTIVLPEGAQVLDVVSEVPFDKLDESVTYSYLDLYGRKTIELSYSNLFSELSDKTVYITYKYSLLTALRKPFTYAAGFFLTLLSWKIYSV